MQTEIIVGILALVGVVFSGAIGSLITVVATRNSRAADAAKAASDAVTNLLQPLNERVDWLEAELKRFKRGVDRLIDQIRCLGHEPVWTPDMDDKALGKKNGRSAKA
jgi:hypothetical protein